MHETHDNLPDRIYDTFLDKTILLTGATGFLGKAILERFLRQFEVRTIYLLIREKRNRNPTTRLKEIFSNPLFRKVRDLKGDKIFEKCKVINGDVGVPNLNIAKEDRFTLANEVEFVIHAAATVRFDEPLKRSVIVNTKGTFQILDLAKEMKKLQVFVYVSTAFCHPEEKVLYEKIYPSGKNPDDIIAIMDLLDDDQAKTMTPSFLGNVPNTYTFSKALTEEVIANELDNLPIIIIRPSIVISIWKEPLPGWIDNVNGPTGLLIAAGKGVLRSINGNKDAKVDFITADAVSDGVCCCVSYFLANQGPRRIFNFCSGNDVTITWNEVIEMGKELAIKKVPFDTALWCPGGKIRKSKVSHFLAMVFYHFLPALLVDTLALCFGYKPFLWRIQKRIFDNMEVISYYVNNEWTFNMDNAMSARDWLNSRERSLYTVDSKGLVYEDYFTDALLAARRYLMKEPDENLPRARRFMKMMYWLDKVCNILIKTLLAYLFYTYVFLPILRIMK